MSLLIKNTTLYTIGNILPQVAGFILLPIYTRYLTPADYGIVSSMQVLSTILAIFFTLAIDRSIFRLYFDYETDRDKKDYLGTITISLVVIATIILSILFIFKGFVGLIYESIEFYPFYLYAILTAFLTVFSIVPKIYLQINEKADKFVLLSTVQYIFNTGFVLWFVIGDKSGAEGMLKGQLFGNIIILPIYFYLAYRVINFTFKLKLLKESLSFSLPMIPGLMAAWVLNLSDRVFIERYFDLHDVGIYSLGYKIASLVLILASALYLALNPVFYRLANSKDQKIAKSKLYQYNSMYIIVILLITFLIAIFSKEAIQLLLDKKYFESYKIVPIISFAYLISQTSGLFNLMIYQEKKVSKLMWISITGACLNIMLNFLFVPKLAAYGAAYSTVLSFMVVFILSFLYAKKCYYIPFNWRQIVPVISLLFVIAVLFLFMDLNVYLTLLIKVIVCFVLGFLFLNKYYKQLRVIFIKS